MQEFSLQAFVDRVRSRMYDLFPYENELINQTKHKVFLEIVCEIQALSIVADTLVSTTLRIPIVETVIVGGVPSTYYHLESWRNDDMLNVLE